MSADILPPGVYQRPQWFHDQRAQTPRSERAHPKDRLH